jgi:hypothetical protein
VKLSSDLFESFSQISADIFFHGLLLSDSWLFYSLLDYIISIDVFHPYFKEMKENGTLNFEVSSLNGGV